MGEQDIKVGSRWRIWGENRTVVELGFKDGQPAVLLRSDNSKAPNNKRLPLVLSKLVAKHGIPIATEVQDENSERRETMATTEVKPDPKQGSKKNVQAKNGNSKPKSEPKSAPKLSKAQSDLREKIAKLKKKAAGIRWRINHASEKNVPAERVEKWKKQLDEVDAEIAKLENEKS